MKKEVVVCDLLGDIGGSCTTLAKFVCPLCQRDVCPQHCIQFIQLALTTVWPQRQNGDGRPAGDVNALSKSERQSICRECWERTGRTKAIATEAALAKMISEITSALAADLAAATLEKMK